MLATMVLAGIIAAPLASILLLLQINPVLRTTGALGAARRSVFAVIGTAALCLVIYLVLRLLGYSGHAAWPAVAALAIMSALWLPLTRRWNARAHLCWAASVLLFATYLVFILHWTFTSHLGVASTVGGVVLWVLEAFAALLACAYLWELCDTLGIESWQRRVTAATPIPAPTSAPGGGQPFVSLHVPAYNEPPEMVIATLERLRRLDYPAYEIIVIDDNTEDQTVWQPVSDWCAAHEVKFAHLADWPGYKSGALNYALRELTDPRAELVGVVDSDYQIMPEFLARCAPLFADPEVGFIQAPQDYRGWQEGSYFRRLYYSYRYFFAVSQPSRNERNGAIFAGTMGLIRRRALEEVGGWDEWCITEDAELSLRLLQAGWSGLHVDESFGYGIMPLTFEGLKSQRYRWCFGGVQILRMHLRSLLPGRQTADNRLTLGQRWAYLSGGVQWYGDLIGFAFYLFLLAGAANLADGGGQLFRKLSPFLAAVVPVMVALGLLRAVAMVRRGSGASWREAFGVFFIWQSTSLVVARACSIGLFAHKAAFLRTPKTSQEGGWRDALRANWAETLLALCGAAGIVGALLRAGTTSGLLLAGLLLFPAAGLFAAPVNSLAALRAALPADLRERRRTEAMRARRTVVRTAAATGATAAAIAGIAAVVALLLAPSHGLVQGPRLVNPKPAAAAPTKPGTSTPSASSTTPVSSPTTTATTPAPTPSGPASPSATAPAPSDGAPSGGASSAAPSTSAGTATP
jgi:glycosyltransferase involved in cell wall biosynthesis